jgi:hypothetical protein
MYLPNFLDGFDRLVAFDAETTGKRMPRPVPAHSLSMAF